MKILEVEQGTLEWHEERRCTITGSKFENVMGTPLARVQLIAELIAEEATEQSKIIRPTAEMERGTNEEEFAIKLFEKSIGRKFIRGNMWRSDEYPYLACSPDAYRQEKNGDVLEAVETKNPDSKTAIMYRLLNMVGMDQLQLGTWLRPTKDRPESVFSPSAKTPFLGIPAEYKWQCINYFLVNRKLKKLHFVVHDARFIDPSAKLYVITLERDNEILQHALMEAEEALTRLRADWEQWKEIVLPTAF